MFEQSQLQLSAHDQRKPASMIAGFALQAVMLGGALLASLFFTEAVPGLRFDSSLIAPPSQRRNAVTLAEVPRLLRPVRVNFTARPAGFFAPTTVPDHVVILDHSQTVAPIADQFDMPGFLPTGEFGPTGIPESLFNSSASATTDPPPPPPAPHKPVVVSAGPVRVGGEVAAARLLHRVQPRYPPLARQARIQGTVRLEAIINEAGEITNLRVLSGHPLLIAASLEAVSQWRYQPTQLNGMAVAVITTIDVNFRLGNE